MEEQLATRESDVALRPFLSAPDEAEAERLLGRLLSDHADPMGGLIGRKLSNSRGSSIAGREDVEEILGPIGLALLIWNGVWPKSTIILCATNDLIWWIPFSLYLHDAWPGFVADLRLVDTGSRS